MLEMLYAEARKGDLGEFLSRRLFLEGCPLPHYFTAEYQAAPVPGGLA